MKSDETTGWRDGERKIEKEGGREVDRPHFQTFDSLWEELYF